EHGLMCEYLYAQFSLKRGTDEGLTPAQLVRVQAWEAAMISVIKQEMLHLALATNVLTAIGAAPHFERPNFPILSHWYPPGVQIALVPFGERALRHFIYLERPEGMALDDAAGFAADQHAQPLTVDDAGLVAVPEEWQTVGHLYRGIEAGLANLCARYGEDAVFIGPTLGAGGHRHLRVARTDRRHRPRVGRPCDRNDRGAGRRCSRRLDPLTLRHLRGNPGGPAGRAGSRSGIQSGPP